MSAYRKWVFKTKLKAQVLLITLFLLALSTIIVYGLTSMWKTELRINVLKKDNLSAFYLAQAGVERAKAELKNDWLNWQGMDSNNNDIAEIGERVMLGQGNYWVDIMNRNGNTQVTIHSFGWQGNCQRGIEVILQRSEQQVFQQISSSWQEI